jgi:hypothetical protein
MLNDIFDRAEPILNYLKKDADLMGKVVELYDNHQKKEKPLEVYLEQLMAIKHARILVISESWCSDCVIHYALFRWLAEECPQIDVRVIGRDGLECIIMELISIDKAKIPCAVVLNDDGSAKGIFVERPKDIRALENSDDQMKRISLMRGYREGLFLWQSLEEILDYLER